MKDLDILDLNKSEVVNAQEQQEKLNELMFRKMERKIERMDTDIKFLDKENFEQANVIHKQSNLIHKQNTQIMRISLAQIFITIVLFLQLIYLAIWLGN